METPTRNWAADVGLKTGYGLANYTSVYDGRVWHGHNGGVMGGLTDMAYLPDSGVGYFISINSGNGKALYETGKAVRDYLTIDIPPEPMPKTAALPKDAAAYAGWYRLASNRNGFMEGIYRLLSLSLVRVKDGALLVRGLGGLHQTSLPVSGPLLRRDNSPVATAALLPQQPEGRFIQFDMGATMQQLPAWLAWLELVLTAWFVLAAASVVLYAPFWLIWGIWKKHRRPHERWLKLWPLIAVVALAADSAISVLVGEDSLERLGNFTAWSAGMWVSSVLFAFACIAALISALLARPQQVRRFVRGYALAVAIPLVIAAAYLTWWGYVGVPLWM